jgi:phage protein D
VTAAIPIYTNNDLYVPAFDVRVLGAKAEDTVRHDVVSVTYKDSLDTFDSVDITLNNWDDSRSGLSTQFTYFVDNQAPQADLFSFDRSKMIAVSLGYRAVKPTKSAGPPDGVNLVTMLEGTVESIEPHYPAGGVPSITIRIINPLKALKDKPNTKTYINKSTADIAREIARNHGLDIVIEKHRDDDDGPQPYVLQNNQFDIVFLLQRARRMGYDLWLDGAKTLHFGPASAKANTTYKLGFHRTLIDFSPRLSMSEQVGKVTVTGRNQLGKSTFTGTVTRSEVGLNGDLDAFLTPELRSKEKTVENQPLHVNGQAKQLAREILRNIMQTMLTATVNAPGLPDIRAGRVLEITDVGSRFSGPYLVTSSTHTIDDGGYKTSFTARREKYS